MDNIQTFYKVVEKGTRHCSNWMMFKNTSQYNQNKSYWKRFRATNKTLFPQYLKNHIIESEKFTPGLMIFKSPSDCDDYIERTLLSDRAIVVKVEVNLNDLLVAPKHIIQACGMSPENLVNPRTEDLYPLESNIFKNSTLFVEKLKVLE